MITCTNCGQHTEADTDLPALCTPCADVAKVLYHDEGKLGQEVIATVRTQLNRALERGDELDARHFRAVLHIIDIIGY